MESKLCFNIPQQLLWVIICYINLKNILGKKLSWFKLPEREAQKLGEKNFFMISSGDGKYVIIVHFLAIQCHTLSIPMAIIIYPGS